jgi:Protein of unknown function (DUF2934)
MPRSQASRETVAVAADPSAPAHTEVAAVNATEIARRAFDLYVTRGREDGHDMDDWLQAEREIQASARIPAE